MNREEYYRKLELVREKIDEIDSKLLPLFMERMKCSEEVAELKRDAGEQVYSKEREDEILRRVEEKSGKYGKEAKALFSDIMTLSRSRQYGLMAGGEELRNLERSAVREVPKNPGDVVCQGVPGAYSHEAALELFPESRISFTQSFEKVFETVQRGDARFGVLPVENSAAGSVTEVYSLILRYRFYIVGAKQLRVEHCLATAVPDSPVTTVISHPQALSQCREYIARKGFSAREFSNTAAAAEYAGRKREKGLAVLCSEKAAERYGLTILERDVQDEKNNRTRFVVISKEPIFPKDASKISLCFSIPHEPGSLTGVLERFSLMGLNMTKIESRPIPGSDFEYDFYLDFTGCIHDRDTLELICSLGQELPRFSFLGNYAES